jgi:thiamine-monophosphate kinase
MLGERKFIEAVRRAAGASRNRAVICGIGDDCAVLRPKPGFDLLVTTDLCIDQVHFRREWHPPASIGHHCLTRGLSDIAAMGGEPLACFLSLGLPPDLPSRWPQQFLRGLESLARRYGIQLSGGDTSAAPAITADIIVVGQVPAGKAVLRSGARPGDRIFVTGQLGASAAALKRLFSGERVRPSRTSPHFFPEPRIQVGRLLRERGLATSMIDLSDGLSVDLSHICDESRLRAVIHQASIPVARGADLNDALHGGEDYELLFTASPHSKVPRPIAGVPITEIGLMHPKSKSAARKHYRSAITILEENGRERPLPPLGWEHFRTAGRRSNS